MPDLGNLFNSSAVNHSHSHSSDIKSISQECNSTPLNPSSSQILHPDPNCVSTSHNRPTSLNQDEANNDNGIHTFKSCQDSLIPSKRSKLFQSLGKSANKEDLGVSDQKLVGCRVCQKPIDLGLGVQCSVISCNGTYHLTCAKERLGFSSKKFKCPQHACYLCRKKISLWRCVRCHMASHEKCAAFPEFVVHLPNQPGQVICWKHTEEQHAGRKSEIEEIFSCLRVPKEVEEFTIDPKWKDLVQKENKLEPRAFKNIRRNIYLVKKKRDHVNSDIGCTGCTTNSTCSSDCVCRVQCISCSKACHCSEMCTNRPFRKDKKIKIVKTKQCGWGAEAAESISKGDFVIEYIGEVIDDALCEKRLWDMKHKGLMNFYMCEIGRDFTIDATFKGNASRFLNHSCDPNCNLEKWQVEGETRIGVFAARSIKAGEPLTYDYRFVQFGPEVECHCGSQNCQGYLGTKRKIPLLKANLVWGYKQRRSSRAQ